MAIHVAILKKQYAELILSGRKTVESRLTKTPQPPYNAIETGERLFIKISSGPFIATALAGKVEQHADLTPDKIKQIFAHLNHAICGNSEYLQQKLDCRYSTFVHLNDVEPLDVGPVYPKSLRAWHVLEDRLSPLVEVTLTAGAIRNRYLSLPDSSGKMRGKSLTLLMPDGREVKTDFAKGKPMLRWRGWGVYYQANDMQAGDVVRIVALGSSRYRVSFHKPTA